MRCLSVAASRGLRPPLRGTDGVVGYRHAVYLRRRLRLATLLTDAVITHVRRVSDQQLDCSATVRVRRKVLLRARHFRVPDQFVDGLQLAVAAVALVIGAGHHRHVLVLAEASAAVVDRVAVDRRRWRGQRRRRRRRNLRLAAMVSLDRHLVRVLLVDVSQRLDQKQTWRQSLPASGTATVETKIANRQHHRLIVGYKRTSIYCPTDETIDTQGWCHPKV